MNILTVTQINTMIRGNLEQNPALQNVCVRGEISNFKLHSSGHVYFTLKDEGSSLRCVMYRSMAGRLRFRPEDGLAALAVGKVTLYVPGGYHQMVCTALSPEGKGDLQLAFEQMKDRLARQGLFDESHKKLLPAFPHRICIVTSPTGDAIRDMLRILGARYPLSQVYLLPVRVQGEGAAGEIAAAIRYADRYRLADVLIVGRGGGSAEDLWPFNEEVVARAIYDCRIPVVSAVGHEPDVSISDYVADVRAATPSNGAELVAPDQFALRQRLDALRQAMAGAMARRLTTARRDLAVLSAHPLLRDPMDYLQERRMQLDLTAERLSGAEIRILHETKQHYYRLSAALEALSPLKVLQRGYSFVRDSEGNIVRSVTQLREGQRLDLNLSDGTARVTVNERKENAL